MGFKLLVTGYLALILLSVRNRVKGAPGTTNKLQEIFVGRCNDYRNVKYLGLLPDVNSSCQGLWQKFYDSFRYKDPCEIQQSDYAEYIAAARQPVPKDKAMFWSGIYDLVHEYSSEGSRYFTLEDTLIGYTVDRLTWCGQKTEPGYNDQECPEWTDCPIESSEAFWAIASRTFAGSVSGKVTVMLDGSNPDRAAYKKDSFFGKHELPFLRRSDVNEVQALVVHRLNKPVLEKCTKKSLRTLRRAVLLRGFKFSCVDDLEAVIHMLCVDDPDNRKCRFVKSFTGRNTTANV